MIIFAILGFVFFAFTIFLLLSGIVLTVLSFIGNNFSLEMTGTGIACTIASVIMLLFIFCN